MELIILMQESVFPKWDLQPSDLKKILKERLQNYFNDTIETKLNITGTICADRRPGYFPEQVEEIKNGQNNRPVIVLSDAYEGTPDETVIRRIQENPCQWVFFYADYTRKGERRRALRINTNGEIIISDDENLTEITKNTVLYPVYSGSIHRTVSRCGSKIKDPVKIPEETIFLNAFEACCIKNWSGDSWICAEHPSVKELRNKIGIIYLQEKQIRCRLIDRPEDETDQKSFDELRELCKELGIPVKKKPSEKTRFHINHYTNWAMRIVETPFDPIVWNSVIRIITAGCRISKLSAIPSEENEAVRDAIFTRYEYICRKTRNLAKESDGKTWLPIQEKWQKEMSENVFQKMTAILPERFMRTDPDSRESYDTVVISYGIRCSDSFPDRADYIRTHKKDFIRAGWAGMEYVFTKNRNRKRAIPLPFLAPVSLRFFAHADLLEITFKLKNKLCTGTAGGKTEKTEE